MCGILWVEMKLQREKEDTEKKAESVGEDVVICPGLKTGGPRHLELVPICPSCEGRLGDPLWPRHLPEIFGPRWDIEGMQS